MTEWWSVRVCRRRTRRTRAKVSERGNRALRVSAVVEN